jgi:hypothetical protein
MLTGDSARHGVRQRRGRAWLAGRCWFQGQAVSKSVHPLVFREKLHARHQSTDPCPSRLPPARRPPASASPAPASNSTAAAAAAAASRARSSSTILTPSSASLARSAHTRCLYVFASTYRPPPPPSALPATPGAPTCGKLLPRRTGMPPPSAESSSPLPPPPPPCHVLRCRRAATANGSTRPCGPPVSALARAARHASARHSPPAGELPMPAKGPPRGPPGAGSRYGPSSGSGAALRGVGPRDNAPPEGSALGACRRGGVARPECAREGSDDAGLRPVTCVRGAWQVRQPTLPGL